jgi:hypothetical protein
MAVDAAMAVLTTDDRENKGAGAKADADCPRRKKEAIKAKAFMVLLILERVGSINA